MPLQSQRPSIVVALTACWLLAHVAYGCDRRRPDGHCNYGIGVVVLDSRSNATVNWTVPANLTIYGVQLQWINGSVTSNDTAATGASTFGDPVNGASLTMFTTNASAPIVPDANYDTHIKLSSALTAPPTYFYAFSNASLNISSATVLTLWCSPIFVEEGTVLRLWNSDQGSRDDNAGTPAYAWTLITNFATNTTTRTTSRSRSSSPRLTASRSEGSRSASRSVSAEATQTRTITPKFHTRTRSHTFQTPAFLGNVATQCQTLNQQAVIVYNNILQKSSLPKRPAACAIVFGQLAAFQPSAAGPDAQQRLYAKAVLGIDTKPTIDAYWLTLPNALKQCAACTTQVVTAVSQTCAVANASVIRAVVSTQAKLLYPRCFATVTPTLVPTVTRTRSLKRHTATATVLVPATTVAPATAAPTTTVAPPPPTTTAAPITTTTQSPPATPSPAPTNSTSGPTAAPMSSDASTTSTGAPTTTTAPTTPAPLTGNATTPPAVTSTIAPTPPVTTIPTTPPPTMAPTLAPTNASTPIPPAPTAYAPGAIIQFFATVQLNGDGTFDLTAFTNKLAGLLGVAAVNIAPVVTGTDPANGTATVNIVFVGDDRDKLQNALSALTQGQLSTIGVMSLGAAPVQTQTPAPPSDAFARPSSPALFVGMGLIGLLVVAGVVGFFLMRRHRGRLVAKVDMETWDQELLTVPGPSLVAPTAARRSDHFNL